MVTVLWAVSTVTGCGDNNGTADAGALDSATADTAVGDSSIPDTGAIPDGNADSSTGDEINVLFYSDWSAGTGTGQHTDGDKWDRVRGFPDEVFTVFAAGDNALGGCAGFPHSDNVLGARYNGPSGSTHQGNAQLGLREILPTDTTSFMLSLWFCNANTSGEEGWSHPLNVESWPGRIQYILWQMQTTSPSEYNVSVNAGSHPDGQRPGFVRYRSPALDNGTWYEHQVIVERVTRETTRMYVRLLDVDGNVIYDSDDYQNGFDESLTERWSRPPASISEPMDALRDITFGPEGPATPDRAGSGEFTFFARFLLTDTVPEIDAPCWLCGSAANRR